MKQTKQNRLLTFLAITGLTFTGPSLVNAQDGFGLIRPAQPARIVSTESSQAMPPIVASAQVETQRPKEFQLPPIVGAEATNPPVIRKSGEANSPLPFAASRIHQAGLTEAPSDLPPIRQAAFAAQQDLPQAQQPFEASRSLDELLPPIMDNSAQPSTEMALPPIVNTPKAAPPIQNPIDASLEPMSLDRTPTPAQSSPQLDMLTPIEMPQPDTATGAALQKGNGYSTAGVPIYSASMPSNVDGPPPIVASQVTANLPSIVTKQEVATPVTVPTEVVPPQPIPLLSPPPINTAAPMATNMDPVGGMNSIVNMPTQSQMIGQPLMSSNVMPAPEVGTPYFDNMGSEQGVAGCQSCGSGGCYDSSSVSGMFNSCGSCSQARRYFIADALYFDRDDGVVNNSNFGSLNNFDWNAGWRFTLGRRMDSTQGRELTYMGTLPMDQSRFSTSPTGIITSRFIPADGFGTAQTSGFFNATQQLEAKQTSFHSLEINRVRWGWDVLKTYLGFRYMYIDDSYTMYSQSITNDQGFFQLETMNHLFGPHIGAELFYDVGYRMSFSLVSKFGVYANINETDTVMFNNGTQFLNTEDREGTISTSYEFGLNSHFRLNSQARFRLGYNFLYLGDVASVSDNFPRFLTPSTVSNATDDDEMFFHGVSFGFEIYR